MSAYDAVVLSDNPAGGYWPLDQSASGTALDLANGNNATWTVDPNYGALPAPGGSRASYFNGTSYATVTDTAVLRQSNGFTIECWYRSDSNATIGGLVSKIHNFGAGTGAEYALRVLDSGSGNALALRVWNASTGAAQFALTAPAGTTITQQRFRHALACYTTSLAVIFLDGREVGRTTGTWTLGSSTTDLKFGNQSNSASQLVTGSVCKAALYRRFAPELARQHYEAGRDLLRFNGLGYA